MGSVGAKVGLFSMKACGGALDVGSESMTNDVPGLGAGRGKGRIVSLDGSRRAAGSHPAIEGVRRYWSALRGERLVPLRSEIDPRGIEGALDCAFILERIAPGIARFRLAGSQLVDLTGSEVRGMPLSVLFAPESRPALSEAIEGVFSGPEVLHLSLAGERSLARPPFRAEMVVLPLKSDLGDVTRALGCFSTSGPLGRTPRRLVIRSLERKDLLAGGSAPSAPPPEAAEGATLRPIPGAPHLKVVEPTE